MVSALKELLEQNRREAALSKHTSYTLKTWPFSQTCSYFHPLPVAGELMDSSKGCLVPVDWINRLSAEIKGLRTMRSAISPNPPMSSPHLIYYLFIFYYLLIIYYYLIFIYYLLIYYLFCMLGMEPCALCISSWNFTTCLHSSPGYTLDGRPQLLCEASCTAVHSLWVWESIPSPCPFKPRGSKDLLLSLTPGFLVFLYLRPSARHSAESFS